MESLINKPEEVIVERKKLKKLCFVCSWFFTVVYVLGALGAVALFCIVWMIAGLSKISIFLLWFISIIALCVPLSIPVAIFLIWNCYFKDKYKLNIFCYFIPIYACGLLFACIHLCGLYQLLFK